MKIIRSNSKKLESIFNRCYPRSKRVEEKVRQIIDDVRLFGDDAVVKYTRKFDGVKLQPRQLKVSQRELSGAYQNITPNFVASLKIIFGNINRFYSKALKKSWKMKGG